MLDYRTTCAVLAMIFFGSDALAQQTTLLGARVVPGVNMALCPTPEAALRLLSRYMMITDGRLKGDLFKTGLRDQNCRVYRGGKVTVQQVRSDRTLSDHVATSLTKRGRHFRFIAFTGKHDGGRVAHGVVNVGGLTWPRSSAFVRPELDSIVVHTTPPALGSHGRQSAAE